MQYSTEVLSPYRRLAVEMILQALTDVALREKSVKNRHRQVYRRMEKEDAEKWFNDNDHSPLGYGWCLGLAGVRRSVIQSKFDDALQKGKDHQS